MLTLTRKIGEALCIGDDIKIVVKEIRGKQVRLGIQAPPEIYVCREELYRKIHTANVMAAAGSGGNLDALGGIFAKPKAGAAPKKDGAQAKASDEAPEAKDGAGQEEQSNAG